MTLSDHFTKKTIEHQLSDAFKYLNHLKAIREDTRDALELQNNSKLIETTVASINSLLKKYQYYI